ncbi:MAG: DUF4172 domain-containing protein [Phormidesmis sp. RL_2_1]|nr:DUF4172 domain-containing protein [Phormidesmis sp. RL_2_1]
MTWIHQANDWPAFTWNSEVLVQKLADTRYRQGRLLGQMTSATAFNRYHRMARLVSGLSRSRY